MLKGEKWINWISVKQLIPKPPTALQQARVILRHRRGIELADVALGEIEQFDGPLLEKIGIDRLRPKKIDLPLQSAAMRFQTRQFRPKPHFFAFKCVAGKKTVGTMNSVPCEIGRHGKPNQWQEDMGATFAHDAALA